MGIIQFVLIYTIDVRFLSVSCLTHVCGSRMIFRIVLCFEALPKCYSENVQAGCRSVYFSRQNISVLQTWPRFISIIVTFLLSCYLCRLSIKQKIEILFSFKIRYLKLTSKLIDIMHEIGINDWRTKMFDFFSAYQHQCGVR